MRAFKSFARRAIDRLFVCAVWILTLAALFSFPMIVIVVMVHGVLAADGRNPIVFDSGHPNAVATKRLGQTVIEALQRYQSERGDYPGSLEMLEPRYLAQVPSPQYGVREWSYRTLVDEAGRSEFVLAFHANGRYPIVFYESERSAWCADQ